MSKSTSNDPKGILDFLPDSAQPPSPTEAYILMVCLFVRSFIHLSVLFSKQPLNDILDQSELTKVWIDWNMDRMVFFGLSSQLLLTGASEKNKKQKLTTTTMQFPLTPPQ